MKINKSEDELVKIFNACPKTLPPNVEDFVKENQTYGYLFIKRTTKAYTELDDSGLCEAEIPAGAWVHCTRCGCTEFFEGQQNTHKHKDSAICPCCDAPVKVYDLRYSHKATIIENNFAYLKVLNENEAYISCYFADFDYSGDDVESPAFTLQECERYYFTPGYSVRWRFDTSRPNGWGGDYHRWTYSDAKKIATFSEPFIFHNAFSMRYENYCYDFNARKDCFLRYSALEIYEQINGGIVATPYGEAHQDGVSIVKYLQNYCTAPILEKLLKIGYQDFCFTAVEAPPLVSRRDFNFKADTVQEFFRGKLSKLEIKKAVEWEPLQISTYITLRDSFIAAHPEKPMQKLLEAAETAIILPNYTLKSLKDLTAVCLYDAVQYLIKSNNLPSARDYVDYIKECVFLELDLSDKSVIYPKNLATAHARTTQLAEIERDKKASEKLQNAFDKRFEYLKNFVFTYGPEFIIRVPKSALEIKAEGKILSHCVGGYAEDHANGLTNILFVRKCSDYDTPFYTLEMNEDGTIEQCRGYKNNRELRGGKPKPPEMEAFEKVFEKFAKRKVAELKRKAEKERIKAKTKQRQRVRIGA